MLRFLKAWLPVVIWAAVILSAANDSFSDDHTRHWLERTLGRDLPEIVNVVVRKGGHVLAYALLGLLAWRAHRTLFVALLVAFVVASIDETLQAQTLTRGGSVFDVLLDTSAALLALMLVPAVRARLSET